MADLPAPVDMTTSVSRPARTDSIASCCPGRRASKPKVSRATFSIRGVDICTRATSLADRLLHKGSDPCFVTWLENVLLQPAARVEGHEQRHQRVHQQRNLACLAL